MCGFQISVDQDNIDEEQTYLETYRCCSDCWTERYPKSIFEAVGLAKVEAAGFLKTRTENREEFWEIDFMSERTMNLKVEGTFGWPFCTNFAASVDEALGRIEENILLDGTTQNQLRNKTSKENLCRVGRAPDTS